MISIARKLLLCIVFLFSLWALGGYAYNHLIPYEEGTYLMQVKEGNFVITLESKRARYSPEDQLEIWATIRYTGVKPTQKIFHSSSIVLLSLEGLDNQYQQSYAVGDILKTTTLFRNAVHRDEFVVLQHLKLQPGRYLIKAYAVFSTHEVDMLSSRITIPVELVVHITNE